MTYERYFNQSNIKKKKKISHAKHMYNFAYDICGVFNTN